MKNNKNVPKFVIGQRVVVVTPPNVRASGHVTRHIEGLGYSVMTEKGRRLVPYQNLERE